MHDLVAVLRENQPALVARITPIVGSAEAEDVLAIAVERLLRHRARLTPIADATVYVRRVVDTVAAEHVRAVEAQRERERCFEEACHAEPSPSIRHVHRALESLSPQQRSVVELVYFRGLDQRTAAEEMGITKGAVSRHLDRAKQKLRWQLAPAMNAA
jgi:RNA polymerase sigma factor (sigma-70 family)